MALSPVHMVRLALVGLLAFLSIASGRPAPLLPRAIPVPDDDPFYKPPAGFESKAPGTILANRTISAAFLGIIPNKVEAHQLLYRTVAIDGSAISTVTTIFKPKNAKLDRLVNFATAYDSSGTKCNPSYVYQKSAQQDSLIASVEMLLIEIYVTLGYTVVSSDYEGPHAAFGAGRMSGTGVLDGIRAAMNFKALGLKENPMVVGVGYSGGGIATGWAASLQPKYAPELNIKGWVQGGTPANLTGTMDLIDNTAFAGFLPAAIAGLAKPSAYGAELNPILDAVVTAEGKKVLASANTECAITMIASFLAKSIFDTDFQTMGKDFIYDPTIQKVLKQNTMAVNKDETPTAPTFVYHATQDEIIPYNDASKMVKSWCDWDANVKFTTYASGGHATTEIISLPDVLKFVENAFDGKTKSGCTKNTQLGSVLNPLALGLNLEPILVKLIDGLAHLGDADANVKSDPVSVLGTAL